MFRFLPHLATSWIVLLLSLALPSCGDQAVSDDGNTDQDSTAAATENGKKPRRERATSVNIAPSIQADLVLPVIAEGTIRARHAVEIRTEIAGRVERVPVSEGQEVKKGQVLVEIDGREYRVAMDEARAEYLEALSRFAVEEGQPEDIADIFQTPTLQLERHYDELDELERSGQISREDRLRQELELELQALRDGTYRRDVVGGRSGVAQARAAVERARLDLERTRIVAPFAGVITGLTLTPGEQLQGNEAICELVDNVNVEAEVGVLESDLGGLEVGRVVLLGIPALRDTIRATVDVISPQIDRASRTCSVLIRVRSESGRIRPGMFVRAAIAGHIVPDRTLVPREAILTREGRPLLFKIEGDRAKWLYVDLGDRNDTLVEVKRVLQGGELAAGNSVIVSNHLTLAHEAKIKVKRMVEPKDPWAQ